MVTFLTPGALFMPKSAPPVTTTLDPATEFDTTLSNGNLTATGATSGAPACYAVSTTSHASGQFYYEVTIVSNPQPNGYAIGCGIANTSAVSGPGGSGSGIGDNTMTGGIWANSGDGHFYQNNNASTVSGIVYGTNGDVVGVALDIGNNRIWYRVNGGNWNGNGANNPVTNVGGINVSPTNTGAALWALVMSGIGNQNGTLTINFGATAFSSAAPSGFGSW